MNQLFSMFSSKMTSAALGLVLMGVSACSSTSEVQSSFDYENMDVKASPVLSPAEEMEAKMNRMFFNHEVDKEGKPIGRSQFEGKRFDRRASTIGGEFEKKEYGDHPYYEFRNNVGFDKNKFNVKRADETQKTSPWERTTSDESGDRFATRKADESSQNVERKGFDVGRGARENTGSASVYEGEKYWYRILRSPNEDAPLDVKSVRDLLTR